MTDTRTFKIYDNIEMKEVRYKNRYGIEIVAHMYLPENYKNKRHPAIIVSGPFGAVKEQASGLYAQQMATYGFVGLAFDPSFNGESGGETRNFASPEIFTEDYSASVDYLGLLDFIDRDKIGVIGICGLSGMAITAASTDTRIKAVATMSMYDMSRDMSQGYKDYYSQHQKGIIKDYLSKQRWKDAEKGTYALGNHEIAFDENNHPLVTPTIAPMELDENADEVTKMFFNYYVKRARHPRAVNFVSSWIATMPYAFWNFPLMHNIKQMSGRPILMVAGDRAHSRYYSEDAYKQANQPKQLMIIEDADHCDLYDNFSKIPFDTLNTFFVENLKKVGGDMKTKYPKIALGAWAWGSGSAGGDQVFGNHLKEDNLKPVFEKAMQLGLHLWDTAAVYGEGSSETILGHFIQGINRDDVIVSTKFTPQIASDDANAMQQMLDGSKQRLHVDTIDIYWIHNPMDVEKWTPDLIPLLKSGQVKSVGVSNHNLQEIKCVNEILSKEGYAISAVQNHYSLLHRSSEYAGILDYCKENNITFYAYMVLEQGALSGKYDSKHLFTANTARAEAYNAMLEKIDPLLAALKAIGDKHHATQAQIATAWAIHKGSLPIIGVTKVEQVEQAYQASKIQLTSTEVQTLEDIASTIQVHTLREWEKDM